MVLIWCSAVQYTKMARIKAIKAIKALLFTALYFNTTRHCMLINPKHFTCLLLISGMARKAPHSSEDNLGIELELY